MTDGIKDVWAHNLEEEMSKISELIEDYPYIAMDTEFPGVIAKPLGSYSSKEAFTYQQTRLNVNFLKIIQIGITLGDGRGGFPKPINTWQFNFKFNLETDMHTTDAIKLLNDSGIDFKRFNAEGITPYDFSQLAYTSGLVMNDHITYLAFHASSDFAYLYKMLTSKPLPVDEKEFDKELNVLFPHFYDLKLIAEDTEGVMSSGLQTLATELNVPRIGPQHQAGSDALVTLSTFTALMNEYFNGVLEQPQYENKIYSLSS